MNLWLTGPEPDVAPLQAALWRLLSVRGKDRWFFLSEGEAAALLAGERPSVARMLALCEALAAQGCSVLCRAALSGAETQALAERPGHAVIEWDGAAHGGDPVEIALVLLEAMEVPLDRAYPYDREDRLLHPHKYQYTPYEGNLLLSAYQDARRALTDRWAAALSALSEACPAPADAPGEGAFEAAYGPLFPGIGRFFAPLVSGEEEASEDLETSRLFAALLQQSLEGPLPPERDALVLRFLKKFEVGKRFFARYHRADYRKAGEDWQDPLPYLLFANVLALWTGARQSGAERAIGMNALLKLDDAIASVADRLYHPLQLALGLRAFTLEQDLYACFAEGRES